MVFKALKRGIFVMQMVRVNELQMAAKCRREQQERKDAEVFQALWTEDLNAKRLRERRALASTSKKAEQLKAALLDQV